MLKTDQELAPPIQKEVKKEVKKPLSYIASMMPQKGQSVWVYDYITKELRTIGDSDFEKITVSLTGKQSKKLIMKKNCLYVVAINKKNAAKKFLKLLSDPTNF